MGSSPNGARSGRKKRSRPALRSGPLAIAASGMSSRPSSASTSRAGRQLTGAAVDQQQVGPTRPAARRVFPQRAAETAAQHLAHHAIIVARRERLGRRLGHAGRACRRDRVRAGKRRGREGRREDRLGGRRFGGGWFGSRGLGGADVEPAIAALVEALRPGDDHRAERIGAGDVAVVVDLDPLGHLLEPERGRHALEQAALRGALGQPPCQRFAGVGQGMVEHLALGAARRPVECDLAPGLDRQRLGDQRLLGQRMADQHGRRRRLVVVELADERGQHIGRLEAALMAREIGPIAEIAARRGRRTPGCRFDRRPGGPRSRRHRRGRRY